jgi:hypothetical protein
MNNKNVEDIKYRLTPVITDKNNNNFSRVLDHKNYKMLEWNAHSKTNYAFKCHYGQRKLLFSEIELFNKVQIKSGINLTTNYKDPPFYVVYAGSAAGHHIVFLLDLFPALRFILYDPAQFDHSVFNNPKIYVKTGTPDGYFTDKTASLDIYQVIKTYFKDERPQKNKNQNGFDLIFISDIRKSPNERGIFEDMMFQQKWGILMNAYVMLLKFRLPYTDYTLTLPKDLDINASDIPPPKIPNKIYRSHELDDKGRPRSERDILGIIGDYPDGILKYYCKQLYSDPLISPQVVLPHGIKYESDMVNRHTTDVLYLDGDIYWQITAPYHSTETRLMVFRNKDFKYNFKFYNSYIYECECFYFNIVDNVSVTYKYKDNQSAKLHVAGFDDGYGCTSEYAIIEEYITTNYKNNNNNNNNNKRIISLLYDINRFLYSAAYRKTLTLCNTETFLKYMGLINSNEEDLVINARRLNKMNHEERIFGFKQLLESIETTTNSCHIQKNLFTKYIKDNNSLLTSVNYNEQVNIINQSIQIQLKYIEKIEYYKSYRDIIKNIITIRKQLSDNIGAPTFDVNYEGDTRQPKGAVLYQMRVSEGLDKSASLEWDIDKSRFKDNLTIKPNNPTKYVNVSHKNKDEDKQRDIDKKNDKKNDRNNRNNRNNDSDKEDEDNDKDINENDRKNNQNKSKKRRNINK